MQTNRIAVAGAIESTAGTRVATVADVDLFGVGQPTISGDIETIGQRADGTFREGGVHGNKKTITFPDFNAFFVGSGTPATAPKMWKYFQAAGWYVDTTGAGAKLGWNGIPTCHNMSLDCVQFACNGKANRYKGRGMVGNASVGFTGGNGSFLATFNGFQGAYVGKDEEDLTHLEITGADTGAQEKAGRYALLIGSSAYVVEDANFTTGNALGYAAGNNDQGITKGTISNQSARVTLKVVQIVTGDTTIEDYLNGTTFATITLVGSGTAKFDITITSAQIIGLSADDSDGSAAWNIEIIPQKIEFVQK